MSPKLPASSPTDLAEIPPPPADVIEAAQELEEQLQRYFAAHLGIDIHERPTLIPC